MPLVLFDPAPALQLQTFNTVAPCQTIQDLTNGVTMAQILHEIDYTWFDEGWLSRIKDDVGDNKRIKINNLKKILQGIVDYYHEFLDQHISEYLLPNLNQIADHSDATEMGRLLQLILGCAVNCEKKQEHIQVIMTLEESVQHVVMTAIQELMSKETLESPTADLSGDLESQLRRTIDALHEAQAEKEELKQRCEELDLQVAALQDERNCLIAENELQNERLDQLDTFDEPSPVVSKKYSQMQIHLEQMKDDNYRLEAAKEDYRIHCEELEKQLVETQNRNVELASLAEESRALKDEIDILRATTDKASKLESTVETYRKKLEDLADMRRQVKSLEDTNLVYMHNIVSLEEELKKANAARVQLESYKRQVQELHNKLSLESKRADTLAYEMKRLQEKQETVLKEKEKLLVQCTALKETNEELRCSMMQQDHLNQSDGVINIDNLAAELLPAEYREMFIRLQHENKMLRLQQEGSENQKITDLQSQMEEKQRKMSELETENRLNMERVEELQLQVGDLQKTLQNEGTEAETAGSSTLKKTIEAQMEKLKEVHEAIETKKELLEDLQPDANQNSERIEELEAALRKKDEDTKAMEDRYKVYLEKAKNVIKTLDPKLNPASAEIMLLRKQLTEKDKKIELLESECQQAKLREYEEKLIVTAWYNKGIAHQKLAMESRLSGRGGMNSEAGSPARSFLAQQRNVTNAMRTIAVTVHPTASN
ncbi:protein Hook homolog 1 isoform X2 [Xenopus laevis]|uniref:Protein Hook homolog 1 isoform X2 n=1 Tax=Xenopus laevis TaxID=8355 RepID=A0A8J0V7B2_XENLA|nr:protein Hook homolog 1 isoform X2 [Xenopus laevis]